jgi:alkylation response protein AidB-like acyl-CoA dehydrogenase
MDLDLTSEQQLLQDSIRGICTGEMDLEAVRRAEARPETADGFRQKLNSIGLPGIRIPVEHGGSGLGLTEAVVAFFELGRAIAPTALLESSVMAPALLSSFSGPDSSTLLEGIANGSLTVVPTWHEPTGSTLEGVQCRVSFDAGVARVDGEKTFVPHVAIAKYLLMPARDAQGGLAICVVDTSASGITETPLSNFAGEPLSRLAFRQTPVKAVLSPAANVEDGWTRMVDEGLVALAAFAAGGAQRVLDMSREYACEREQFGKRIAEFQSIAHYLADAAVETDSAYLLAYRAASEADKGLPYGYWASVAKLHASKTFRDVSALAIQIHGGLGFTLEGDPQLFFRRSKHLQLILGDPGKLERDIEYYLFTGNTSLYA